MMKMSEFEEALWLSAENWTDSFPTDLPKHKFSKKHNKVINDIIYGKQDKKIKLSKGTIKVLLIAAVLLAIRQQHLPFLKAENILSINFLTIRNIMWLIRKNPKE